MHKMLQWAPQFLEEMDAITFSPQALVSLSQAMIPCSPVIQAPEEDQKRSSP